MGGGVGSDRIGLDWNWIEEGLVWLWRGGGGRGEWAGEYILFYS